MSWHGDELGRALAVALGVEPDEAIKAWADEAVEASRAAFPHSQLSAPRFAAFVADKARSRTGLFGLLPSDLVIAFACAEGDPVAQAWFDRTLVPPLRRAIARVVRNDSQIDDLLQQVRERILVPPQPGAAPRIARYAGEVPLSAWLRAVAVRMALNATRGARPELSDEDALQSAPAALDLETDTLKALHRGSFATAFKSALAGLSPRDRTLLKLFFVDGASTEGIGRMYGVNKSTASRWLAAARAHLLEDTRRRLAAELNLDDREVRSLIRFVRSRVDLSLSTLLR